MWITSLSGLHFKMSTATQAACHTQSNIVASCGLGIYLSVGQMGYQQAGISTFWCRENKGDSIKINFN